MPAGNIGYMQWRGEYAILKFLVNLHQSTLCKRRAEISPLHIASTVISLIYTNVVSLFRK